jgi:ketosteroid isomerase-like protein
MVRNIRQDRPLIRHTRHSTHEERTGDMDVETRLARLEAAAEIRALKMQYARLCDAGYPSDQLGPLFTEDAVWDGGETFGIYEGNQAVRGFFDDCRNRIGWAMHYTVSGDIDVAPDVRAATARWYLWQPMTLEGRAVWLLATYKDEYQKDDSGTWQISHLTLDVQALTPIEEGWVQRRFLG